MLTLGCSRRASVATNQWEELMGQLGGEYAAWAKIPPQLAVELERLEF